MLGLPVLRTMTVNRYATAAGKKYQRDLMKHLRDDLGLDAENLVLTGAEDEGDVVLRHTGVAYQTIIEAKRTRAVDLAGWVKQAEVERDNYVKHRILRDVQDTGFVVVHYRRQHGVAQSYVTTTLPEWLRSQGLV